MKQCFLFCLFTAILFSATAQSRISTVEYQKVKRDALVNELPFPEKLVSNAIKDTLEKLGYKGKESKGFVVYKAVKLEALGSKEHDLYFSVDAKGRKEKNISVVTLMISKGFDDFATESGDKDLVADARDYLNNLREIVAVYDLEQQITEQDTEVKRHEKRSANLTEEAENLQKEKKKLEKKIEDNLKEQENQVKETEKQKLMLETLRGKRKS